LHFQEEYTMDNAASSLLFADGSAALLMSNTKQQKPIAKVSHFHSAIAFKGLKDMAWEISSKGFLMTLSGYVPQLIEEDINALVAEALQQSGIAKEEVGYWCIHPGGRKIVDTIQKQLALSDGDMQPSREVLRQYGNMSSATIFFVLDEICRQAKEQNKPSSRALGVAFGPGLTMETFTAEIA
jgi:predicted naringenin-chalcone synthase